MDRRTQGLIYSDRELNRLRMQSEDLINSVEQMTEEEYKAEADKIRLAIDEKVAELRAKYEGK